VNPGQDRPEAPSGDRPSAEWNLKTFGARSCDFRDFGLNIPEHVETAQHTCNCEVILGFAHQGHRVRGGRWLEMYEFALVCYDDVKGETVRA